MVMDIHFKEKAVDLLLADSQKIYKLIHQQKNYLCLDCPAFEEVVDTHMFGFSKKIEFAIHMEIISEQKGQRMLSDLEKYVSEVYDDVFEEKKKK